MNQYTNTKYTARGVTSPNVRLTPNTVIPEGMVITRAVKAPRGRPSSKLSLADKDRIIAELKKQLGIA